MAAPDIYLETPVRDLIAEFLPEVSEIDDVVAANVCPYMSTAVHEALGWTIAYDWRRIRDEAAVMKGEDGRFLNAGPVRIKFANGELRYLRVSGREVLRRVYFAVRDARWDTVPPNFEVAEVVSGAGEFTVELRARCVNEIADVAWNGPDRGAGRRVHRLGGRVGTARRIRVSTYRDLRALRRRGPRRS